MPTLTGSVADVTGVALSPAQIRQVFVKAPGERPSLADGGVLIVSAPVQLGSSGSLSVTLEPGPAVLTVDTYAGGPDVYDLYVTADMTLLSEAIDEAAPEHERSWSESVMIQLRDEAVAAAGRAVAAAGDVDSAIAGAAGAVVAAVESDRVAAEAAAGAAASSASAADVSAGDASAAAGAAAGSASDADGSASGAASSAVAASGSATSAAGSATDAAGAVVDARAARDAAEGHATSAAGSASAAAGSAAAADGHADRAEAAANEFDLTATSSTLAPGAAATVTVSGDGPAYSLAFGVPQGAKGDKGDEGDISQAQLDAALAGKVDTGDSRLTDARTPTAHTHPVTDLTATGTRSASTYLRGDGSWQTPANTTYTAMPVAEAEAGTASTSRVMTAAVLKSAVLKHSPPTTAASLTGALTYQVDASDAMVTGGHPAHPGDPDYVATMSLSQLLGTLLIYDTILVDLSDSIEAKIDKAGTAQTVWSGTQAQYDALPAGTRNAAGFIAVIVP